VLYYILDEQKWRIVGYTMLIHYALLRCAHMSVGYREGLFDEVASYRDEWADTVPRRGPGGLAGSLVL
jgi:hypothetical protein